MVQKVFVAVITGAGEVNTVTIFCVTPVQPFALVTVTLYVPAAVTTND